jgi:hypothetical protein
MLVTSRQSHTKLGFIPEMKYILLRNNTTGTLELWTHSRGIQPHSIDVDGVELEYVRDTSKAARVVDNEYNRKHCPDEIGRIYVDSFPNHAYVKEY